MADTPRESGFGTRDLYGPTHGLTSEAIEHAIDVVAREMTSLDAPAALRANVMDRIEAAPPRAMFGLLPRWATAPSLAVVVLAVATVFWFARPAGRPESRDARVGSPAIQATGDVRPGPRASEMLASTGLAATTTAATNAGSAARAEAAGATTTHADQNATSAAEMGPAALALPAPIVIAALGPDALHIPDIGIEPIGELKPITIPEIPGGSTEIQNPPVR